MPRTSNRVEAAEGKARGIGPSRAEHSSTQGVTLGPGVCTLVGSGRDLPAEAKDSNWVRRRPAGLHARIAAQQ